MLSSPSPPDSTSSPGPPSTTSGPGPPSMASGAPEPNRTSRPADAPADEVVHVAHVVALARLAVVPRPGAHGPEHPGGAPRVVERVVAVAAAHDVGPVAGRRGEPVVARAPDRHVALGAAVDHVGPVAPVDAVTAGAAPDGVCPDPALDRVVPLARVDVQPHEGQRVPIGRRRERGRGAPVVLGHPDDVPPSAQHGADRDEPRRGEHHARPDEPGEDLQPDLAPRRRRGVSTVIVRTGSRTATSHTTSLKSGPAVQLGSVEEMGGSPVLSWLTASPWRRSSAKGPVTMASRPPGVAWTASVVCAAPISATPSCSPPRGRRRGRRRRRPQASPPS